MIRNRNRRQLVVIAGGLGTRLQEVGISTPKALLNVSGSSLAERIISEARMESFSEILWCLGHKSKEIEFAIGEYGSEYPSNTFVHDRDRLGTLGALIQAREHLADEFCVIYGDLFISDTNLGKLFELFQAEDCAALILAKFTDHPEDSDLIRADERWNAVEFMKYPHKSVPNLPIGNAGIFFFKKDCIPSEIPTQSKDIFKDLLPQLLKDQIHIRVIFHQGSIRDVGQVNRLRDKSLTGRSSRGLSRKTAVFFDRDGVLNVPAGHIKKREELRLTPFATELLSAAIQEFDYLGLITNQPVVARGEATCRDVEEINSHLLTLSNLPQTTFSVIKYCPHHPDSGFQGEVSQLKKYCSCRKPAPGMIIEALAELHVRATSCVFIGDSLTDLQAAEAVGMKWIHLVEKSQLPCTIWELKGRGRCMSAEDLISWLKNGAKF